MQPISVQKINSLRVAIISDAMPQRNGVGSYYADLAEHFKEHVSQVELICPRKNGQTNYSRVKFSMPGDATQTIFFPRFGHISSRLEKLKPQVIIVPTPGPFGLAGFYWSKRIKAAMVSGFHTDYHQLSDMYFNRIAAFLGEKYLKYSQKLLFHYSAAVLATSEDLVSLAGKLGGKNVEHIGTMLPIKYLATPPAEPAHVIEKIIFVGRLAPEKNIQKILDAADQLSHISFTIAGDGPLKKQVEDQAEKAPNLKYVGWQSRDALLSLLDEQDMLVLPSRVESFGTVALEAMSRAKNVLVSPHCGLLNWPDLKNSVWVMEEGESLAAAIKRTISLPPELHKQKAISARKAAIALNQFSLDHWLSVLSKNIPDRG